MSHGTGHTETIAYLKRTPFTLSETTLRRLVSTGTGVILLLLWELSVAFGWLSPRLVSSPSLVVKAGWALIQQQNLGYHLWMSLQQFVLGFAAAVVIGIAGALVLGWYRRLALLFEPVIMTFYSMPRVALLPVIIVWLGIGTASRAAVVFLGAVFPILMNTMAGLRNADPSLIRAARSFGATNRDLFLYVLLPGALPYMMTGIRLGIGRGVVGAIVAEMYVSVAGLGALIMAAQAGLNTDRLIFVALLTSFLGFLLLLASQQLERRLAPWRNDRR